MATRKTLDERLAAAQDRVDKIKVAKVKELAKQEKTNRAVDTRKKVLIGAFMLTQMEAKEETRTRMISSLDGYLTRADDRALFALPALPK